MYSELYQMTCGIRFTYKMKQMCKDIETSKTIVEQYNQCCQRETNLPKSLIIN